MNSTIKIMQGLAIGMLVGGAAGALIVSKTSKCNSSKKRFTHAIKSACGFIENII